MEGPADVVSLAVEHVRFATASERLGCAMSALKLPLEFIGEMGEADPELAPELAAAVDHIGEAAQALSRAHQFTKARIEVRSARVGRDPNEGGTPA